MQEEQLSYEGDAEQMAGTRSLEFRKDSHRDLLVSWLCKLTKFCFYVSELPF